VNIETIELARPSPFRSKIYACNSIVHLLQQITMCPLMEELGLSPNNDTRRVADH